MVPIMGWAWGPLLPPGSYPNERTTEWRDRAKQRLAALHVHLLLNLFPTDPLGGVVGQQSEATSAPLHPWIATAAFCVCSAVWRVRTAAGGVRRACMYVCM